MENGGKFENVLVPGRMRVCCDPQLGDEGKVSDINMRRIF